MYGQHGGDAYSNYTSCATGYDNLQGSHQNFPQHNKKYRSRNVGRDKLINRCITRTPFDI